MWLIYHAFASIYDQAMLQHGMSLARVSWDTDESQPQLRSLCYMAWTAEQDGRCLFFNTPRTAAAYVKALIAARLPHRVEQKEVAAFLPIVDSQYRDLVFQSMCLSPPLSAVCRDWSIAAFTRF